MRMPVDCRAVSALRRPLALALAGLCAVGLSACNWNGDSEARSFAPNEGVYVQIGDIAYQVQVSRQLNAASLEDREYFAGVPLAARVLPPRQEWFAVWVRAQSQTSKPRPMAADFRMVDTLGTVYRPIPLPPENPLGYRAKVLDRPGRLRRDLQRDRAVPRAGHPGEPLRAGGRRRPDLPGEHRRVPEPPADPEDQGAAGHEARERRPRPLGDRFGSPAAMTVDPDRPWLGDEPSGRPDSSFEPWPAGLGVFTAVSIPIVLVGLTRDGGVDAGIVVLGILIGLIAGIATGVAIERRGGRWPEPPPGEEP